MNTAWELLGHRALSALGNGLYQGMLVTLVVGIALQLLRRANAATRYAVALAALVIVAVLPAAHFVAADAKPSSSSIVGRGNEPGLTVPVGGTLNASLAGGIPRIHTALDPADTRTPNQPAGGRQSDLAHSHFKITQSAAGAWTKTIPRLDAAGSATGGGEAPPALRHETLSSPQNAVTEKASVQEQDRGAVEPVRRAFPWPRAAGLWQPAVPAGVSLGLLALWLLVAGLRLSRLGWQYAALQRLKNHCKPAPAPVAARFEILRREMVVPRAARLGVSPGLTSPVAAGFFQPAVLLPADLLSADEADLDAVLRHELAHLNRRDDWTNLVQQLVQAALFFHPSVWWLSRRLTLNREIACDDHVLAAARPPRDYALFLAEFAGRTRYRLGAAAPAAWSNRSQLKERIHMILDTNRNVTPRPARDRVATLSTAVALIAAAAWYAGPRLAIAQTGPVAATPALPEPPPVIAPKLKGPVTVVNPRNPDTGVVTAPPISPVAPPAPPQPAALAQVPLPLAVIVSSDVRAGGATAIARSFKGPGPMALAAPHPVPSPRPIPQAYVMAGPTPVDGFERRLDRLERMVEKLMVKLEKVPTGAPDGEKFKDSGADARPEGHPKNLNHDIFGEGNGSGEGPDVARVLEQVARDVERATREAERAVMEGQRSADRVRMRVEKTALKRQPLEHERHALHAQREALQRQVESIEHQMERLEEHLERVDEQLEQVDEHIEEITQEREESPAADPARPETVTPAPAR